MKLIVATNNAGKLKEFKRILLPLGLEVLSLDEAGIKIEVEETGSSFQENAMLKAKAVYKISHLPTVADDSGLCVDALDGRPGIYSARYCGEETEYRTKIASLLNELENIPKPARTAHFLCHISCIIDEETVLQCEGICEGHIGFKPKGDGGFGFDPVFYVGEKSYAQLSDDEKDAISHRGRALRLLYQKLEQEIRRDDSIC